MEIMERYLAAVRRELPAARADDIIAELRDDLLTRVEVREERLGRSLDRKELEEVLREAGRPIVVAARYCEHQYLIGPETYPFYVVGLKVGAGIVAILAAVLVGVDLAFGTRDAWQAAMQFVSSVFSMGLTGFGIVTLIFAIIEREGGVKRDADWTLEDLPSIDDLTKDRRKDAPIEIVGGVLFLLWWFGTIPFPPVGWNEQFTVTAAPVWAGLFWPIAAVLIARLAMSLLALGPGRFDPVRHLLDIATTVAGFAILMALFQAGHWVDLGAGMMDATEAAKIESSVNLAIRIALVVGIVGCVLSVMGTLWKMLRSRQTSVA